MYFLEPENAKDMWNLVRSAKISDFMMITDNGILVILVPWVHLSG